MEDYYDYIGIFLIIGLGSIAFVTLFIWDAYSERKRKRNQKSGDK